MMRPSGILFALLIATALTLNLAAPANAANQSNGITAVFTPPTGTLTISGNQQNNTITVSRDAAGTLLVNAGAVRIRGGQATVANTSLIEVSGLAGNDTLSLDEANGVLPHANLFGGDGSDTLSGGSGADTLKGEAGADTLLGKGGNDLLFG